MGIQIALGCALASLIVCAVCLALQHRRLAAERRARVLAETQAEALVAQTRQSQQYYVALANQIQEVRRMQHDSRHHLRLLSAYARDGAHDLLKEYLSTLIEQSPVGGGFYCANYTANILLDFYAEQAQMNSIQFQCDAQIPADLSCSPVDLCAVLGNALQNALDACVRLAPGEERRISLLARVLGRYLTLEVNNSYDGVAVEADGRLLSRKGESGHGLGLIGIQRVAEQYHGYCKITRTQREFTLRVVLTLEESNTAAHGNGHEARRSFVIRPE